MRKGVIKNLDIKKYLEKYSTKEAIEKLTKDSQISVEIVKVRIKLFKKRYGLEDDDLDENNE